MSHCSSQSSHEYSIETWKKYCCQKVSKGNQSVFILNSTTAGPVLYISPLQTLNHNLDLNAHPLELSIAHPALGYLGLQTVLHVDAADQELSAVLGKTLSALSRRGARGVADVRKCLGNGGADGLLDALRDGGDGYLGASGCSPCNLVSAGLAAS